jgi:hypothetical protein
MTLHASPHPPLCGAAPVQAGRLRKEVHVHAATRSMRDEMSAIAAGVRPGRRIGDETRLTTAVAKRIRASRLTPDGHHAVIALVESVHRRGRIEEIRQCSLRDLHDAGAPRRSYAVAAQPAIDQRRPNEGVPCVRRRAVLVSEALVVRPLRRGGHATQDAPRCGRPARAACASFGHAACDDEPVINAALRSASTIALDGRTVSACLDLQARPGDLPFALAWTRSLRALAPHERSGALAGVTGHVAESVVELLLADVGYHPVHDFTGPGRHGVDLLMLSPTGDHMLAIEVKGTLRAGYVPRVSKRAVAQMSAAWVDKADNPGMAEWDLHSDDVYAAVIALNFADMASRVVVSADFGAWRPIGRLDDLTTVAG